MTRKWQTRRAGDIGLTAAFLDNQCGYFEVKYVLRRCVDFPGPNFYEYLLQPLRYHVALLAKDGSGVPH
jgi:hypothetical protein